MATISTSIPTSAKAKTSGYSIEKAESDNTTGNLPMIVAVIGEANTDKQSGLVTTPREVTTSKEAAEQWGYGSPLHQAFRILRPINGGGIGSIRTVAFPLPSNASATATTYTYSVTGTATKNVDHIAKINGRSTLDFQTLKVSISKGDTNLQITAKIVSALNSVTSNVCTAVDNTDGTFTLTSKSKGLTSFFGFVMSNEEDAAGITYAENSSSTGTGLPDLSVATAQFGTTWYTLVLNPYGSESTILGDLETFNGNPTTRTGRYTPNAFKPFIAVFGSSESDRDNLAAITNAADRISECTNVLAAAPNSPSTDLEIAASGVLAKAIVSNDNPWLDVMDEYLSDIVVPSDGDFGDMSVYENRDYLSKNGCSTSIIEDGVYKFQDFLTTYHPEGEYPLQFDYARNPIIDWNIKYKYDVLYNAHVKNKVIVSDSSPSINDDSVKPNEFKSVLYSWFDELEEELFITDAQFSKDSLEVLAPASGNPNRFEVRFNYKRSGIVRVGSATAIAGFES